MCACCVQEQRIKTGCCWKSWACCHPGVKAMRANLLEKALEKCFRQAGGNPTKQPSAYSLLGGHFTKEDLSSLFPGRLNQADAEKLKKLAMSFLDIVEDSSRF